MYVSESYWKGENTSVVRNGGYSGYLRPTEDHSQSFKSESSAGVSYAPLVSSYGGPRGRSATQVYAFEPHITADSQDALVLQEENPGNETARSRRARSATEMSPLQVKGEDAGALLSYTRSTRSAFDLDAWSPAADYSLGCYTAEPPLHLNGHMTGTIMSDQTDCRQPPSRDESYDPFAEPPPEIPGSHNNGGYSDSEWHSSDSDTSGSDCSESVSGRSSEFPYPEVMSNPVTPRVIYDLRAGTIHHQPLRAPLPGPTISTDLDSYAPPPPPPRDISKSKKPRHGRRHHSRPSAGQYATPSSGPRLSNSTSPPALSPFKAGGGLNNSFTNPSHLSKRTLSPAAGHVPMGLTSADHLLGDVTDNVHSRTIKLMDGHVARRRAEALRKKTASALNTSSASLVGMSHPATYSTTDHSTIDRAPISYTSTPPPSHVRPPAGVPQGVVTQYLQELESHRRAMYDYHREVVCDNLKRQKQHEVVRSVNRLEQVRDVQEHCYNAAVQTSQKAAVVRQLNDEKTRRNRRRLDQLNAERQRKIQQKQQEDRRKEQHRIATRNEQMTLQEQRAAQKQQRLAYTREMAEQLLEARTHNFLSKVTNEEQKYLETKRQKESTAKERSEYRRRRDNEIKQEVDKLAFLMAVSPRLEQIPIGLPL